MLLNFGDLTRTVYTKTDYIKNFGESKYSVLQKLSLASQKKESSLSHGWMTVVKGELRKPLWKKPPFWGHLQKRCKYINLY
jgi:hypothetical protein